MKTDMDENRIMLELMRHLKKIYDNKDFVCGTISIARDATVWKELLNCIKTLEEEQEPISSDDILALVLVLRKESDSAEKGGMVSRRIAAAVL